MMNRRSMPDLGIETPQAWSKPFSPPPPSKQAGSKTNSRLLRNNFSNFSAFSSAPTPKEQQLYQEKFQQQLEEQEKLTYSNSVHRPGALELAPEHLNEHSRSQGALESMQQQHQQRGSDQDKYQLTLHQHQRRERPELHHGRSKSQVDLRSQASSMTQANGQQSQHLENGHRLSQSSYRRRLGSDNGQHPTVFIPPPDQTSSQLIPKSADTSAEKDPSSGLSPPFCLRQSMPVSPPTPSTAVTTATSGTPDWSCPRSAGTSMSDASILMGAKAMSSRAWNRLSLSSRTTSLRQSGESTRDHSSDDTSLSSGLDDNIEDLDNPDPDNLPMFVDGMIFQARKPKPTLMRAIKQIVNPRKVAEKDALKSQQEHFAWVEMQKSLRRVRSPEPGGKHDFYLQYFPPIGSTVVSRTPAGMSSLRTDDTVTTTPFSEIDPFEALK
ncbi:hypothetical protein BGZ73_007206 [Actinomortierella ambigua]|nr:hypothetical protein BGZ73_007206 [Actinomortierella ambigua]